jgi:symplekin
MEEERRSLISDSVARIWTGADELPVDSLQAGGTSPNEVWMLLVVRMITRVAQPPVDEEDNREQVVHDFYLRQDQLRQKLCDYIMADFPSRFYRYFALLGFD